MIRKVQNSAHYQASDLNQVLMIAYKTVNPLDKPDPGTRCRFDLFVRVRPGIASQFKAQQRTWCYRGDKYTDEPHKMLRNLVKLVGNRIALYDRIELYDNDKALEERTIIKIVDDCLVKNQLQQYALMLINFPVPDFLRVTV